MPNPFFQFKQFRIDQEGVGMKVTTEGCLLGGWVGEELCPARVLDVGSGTGLLALIMAQKFPEAQIDAIELDETACASTVQNFEASPWNHRLKLYPGAVQAYHPDHEYDLIVCNPPFFHQSLPSDQVAINRARHDTSLSQEELLDAMGRLLSQNGYCYVLYPNAEADRFVSLAKSAGLLCQQELSIFNRNEDKIPFRKILKMSFQPVTKEEVHLAIRNENGVYSDQFVSILKDYYLHL